MKQKIEIQRILIISTSHITEKDNNLLQEVNCLNDKYSYLIYIRKPIEVFWLRSAIHKKILDSPQLKNIIDFARLHNCDYLQLDCDGPVYDDFETFDW